MGLNLSSPASSPFLSNAVEGANPENFTHIISLEGTEVGTQSALRAVPIDIHFEANGYQCNHTRLPSGGNTFKMCCPAVDESPSDSVASPPSPVFPNLNPGILVNWDVMSANEIVYQVVITLTNQQRYAEISSDPGWKLTWDWAMDELIISCAGCQTLTRGDCSNCVACLDDPNVSDRYCCEPSPVVVDGTYLNGSLGSPAFNFDKSSVNFTLTMAKGGKYHSADDLIFPDNMRLILPNYGCNHPVSVPPSLFPSPNGGVQMQQALVSYSMDCGPLLDDSDQYDCCVSASAFYNGTISPCNTCACSCSSDSSELSNEESSKSLSPSSSSTSESCDLNTASNSDPAAQALLGKNLADKIIPGPDKGRCDSNCGIMVHLLISDGNPKGWKLDTAVVNRESSDIKDWTLVLEFPKNLSQNFEQVFSVNASFDSHPYEDNFMVKGIDYYNSWLLASGNIHFVTTFNITKDSPGYILLGGNKFNMNPNVFPERVLFNGHECKMPSFMPQNSNGQRLHIKLSLFISFSLWYLLFCIVLLI